MNGDQFLPRLAQASQAWQCLTYLCLPTEGKPLSRAHIWTLHPCTYLSRSRTTGVLCTAQCPPWYHRTLASRMCILLWTTHVSRSWLSGVITCGLKDT